MGLTGSGSEEKKTNHLLLELEVLSTHQATTHCPLYNDSQTITYTKDRNMKKVGVGQELKIRSEAFSSAKYILITGPKIPT